MLEKKGHSLRKKPLVMATSCSLSTREKDSCLHWNRMVYQTCGWYAGDVDQKSKALLGLSNNFFEEVKTGICSLGCLLQKIRRRLIQWGDGGGRNHEGRVSKTGFQWVRKRRALTQTLQKEVQLVHYNPIPNHILVCQNSDRYPR